MQSYNQRKTAQLSQSQIGKKDKDINQDDFNRQYDIQSKRILELQNYKQLCESYIERLSPNQKLPLCLNDLKNLPKPNTQGIITSSSIEPNEEVLRLQLEKDSLISTLQKETVLNEQQRNYIEILKQTIESSILKNGLSNLLQTSKGFQTQSTLDTIIDISRTQNEIEKSRKDFAMQQMFTNELKAELDSSKKSYEDLTVLSNILKDKLEREKAINAELSKQCSSQEQTVLSLEEGIKSSNDQLKTIKTSLADYQSLCAKYEKEIFESGRKLNEMNNTLSSYQLLQKKFNDNKDSYNRLDFDYQRLLKDKGDLDLLNHKLKEEMALLKEEKKKQNDTMAQREEDFHKEKRTLLEEKEAVSRNLAKTETKHNDIANIVQLKDKELYQSQEHQVQLEKQLLMQQTQMKELSDAYESFKSKAETNAQLDTEKIIEYTKKITDLNKHISNLELDCETLSNEGYTLNESNKKYRTDLEQIINDKETVDSLMKNLSAQYDSLLTTHRQLEIDSNRLKIDNDGLIKELSYWKDKYNKDSNSKGEEIIALTNQLKKLSYSYDDSIKTNDRLKFDLSQQLEAKDQGDLAMTKLRAEVISLANENEVLQRTLNERNKVIRNEEQSTYELTGQLNQSLMQMKEIMAENSQLKTKVNKMEADTIEHHTVNDSLNESNAVNGQRLITLTQSLNSHCKSINQSIESMSQYANRFLMKVKEDTAPGSMSIGVSIPFYTRDFIEYVNDIILNQQKLNSLSPIDKLNELQVFLSHLTIENFNWYNHFKELGLTINDYKKKTSMLQIELERCEVALKDKDDSLTMKENKLKAIAYDSDSIKKSNDTLVNRLSTQHDAMTSASYEISAIKEENSKLIELTNRLNEENEAKDRLLTNANYEVDALEERIVILSKEKKYYEGVIERLGQNSGSKETMRNVNNILTVCDDISQLERTRQSGGGYNGGDGNAGIDRELESKINEYNRLCDSIEFSGRSNGMSDNNRIMTYEFKKSGSNMSQEYNMMNKTNNNSLRFDDTYDYSSTVPNNNANTSMYSSTATKLVKGNNPNTTNNNTNILRNMYHI